MSEPVGKGAGFNTAVGVLKEVISAAEFEALKAAMPPETAALLVTPPLAMAWIPVHHGGRILTHLHTVTFAGNDERIVELGERSVQRDLSTIYKFIIRVAQPSYVIARAGVLYNSYNQHNGRVRVEVHDRRDLTVYYEDVACGSPAHWLYSSGGTRGVIKAGGGRNVEVRIESGRDSVTHCVMRATWTV